MTKQKKILLVALLLLFCVIFGALIATNGLDLTLAELLSGAW